MELAIRSWVGDETFMGPWMIEWQVDEENKLTRLPTLTSMHHKRWTVLTQGLSNSKLSEVRALYSISVVRNYPLLSLSLSLSLSLFLCVYLQGDTKCVENIYKVFRLTRKQCN